VPHLVRVRGRVRLRLRLRLRLRVRVGVRVRVRVGVSTLARRSTSKEARAAARNPAIVSRMPGCTCARTTNGRRGVGQWGQQGRQSRVGRAGTGPC